MIIAALQQIIQNLPTVAPLLARWDFDATHRLPAVFTEGVPPLSCGVPLVCIEQDNMAPFEQVRKQTSRYLTANVTCRLWGELEGSDRRLRKLADKLGMELYKIRHLDLDANVEFKMMSIRGPRRVKSDDGFPGYDFQLEVKYIDRR